MTGANAGARGGLLIGRDTEQALIAARLADREGGTAILVRGPAGIGKTALIDEAVRRGPSRRILRTVGNSPETGLAMAGLYQLLQPLLPLAHLIPEPRQAALRVAFGIANGPPRSPSRWPWRPWTCWPTRLPSSRCWWWPRTCSGWIRRRSACSALSDGALSMTRSYCWPRPGPTNPTPSTAPPACVLDLEPLGVGDSRRLLACVAPDLSSAAQARVLRVAEGNPLALVELPKAPGLTLRAAGGPEWLPLTQRLQAAFAARVERLPSAARTALILLALHDSRVATGTTRRPRSGRDASAAGGRSSRRSPRALSSSRTVNCVFATG